MLPRYQGIEFSEEVLLEMRSLVAHNFFVVK